MKLPRSFGRIVSLLLVLQACGRTDVFGDAQRVSIDPPEATVEFDRSAQFTAETTPPGLEIEWVVLPEGAGTISETGIFRATADTDITEATVRVFLASDKTVFAEAHVALVEQSTGAPDLFVKAGGDNQTATVGEPLPEPLRTRVIDAEIKGVPGIVVVFEGVEKITNDFGIATWTPTAQETSGAQQFEASTEGLGTLTFTAQLEAGPVTSLVVTHAEPVGVAGATMAIPAVVTVTDTFGNPVVGHQAVATPPLDARADALDSASNDDGEQRFSLTLAPMAGTQTFDFESGELQASLDIEATTAVPALLQIESGNDQTQVVGRALAAPLVVRLLDATGAPATAGTLTWTTPDGGELQGAQTQPDRDGFARATFVLPTKSGVVQVKVDAGSVVGSPAIFTLTATPGDATRLEAVSGNGQTTTANQPFGSAFTVRATDANANPVADVLVYFEAVTGGGSVAPTAVQTDDKGLAQATMTAGAAGTQTYRASATGLAGSPIEYTNTAIAVSPGLRLELISGNGQSGAAGSDLPHSLSMRVKSNSAPAAGYAVSFGVAQGGGSVRPTVVTTGTDGVASVTARLGTSEGAQRFSASVPGAENSPIFFDAQALPQPVSTLNIISGNGQSGLVQTPLSAPFVVQALDADGLPLSGRTVQFAAQDGGSVTPASAATDARGLASATATLGAVEGTQRFTARVNDISVTFDATATSEAGGLRLVLVSGNNQSAQVGLALAAPLVVQTLNISGAPVAGIKVRWSAESPQGSVSDAVTTTDATGFAKVTGKLGGTVGNQRFFAEADDASGSPAVFLATALAAPAERLVVVSGNGQNGRPSSALAAPLVVRAVDRLGNGVAGVAIRFTAGAGAGSVTPASTTTNARGEASATATLGSSTGSQTFLAESSGLEPATFTATATNADIAHLSVSPQGKRVETGSSLRYSVIALYDDGTSRDVTEEATWNVLNSSVMSVGDAPGVKGYAWALRAGSTSVKASVGSASGSTPVTVVEATLSSIALEPLVARMSKGSSRAFTATGTFSNNSVANITESASWASTNPAVATVLNTSGSKGLVTAVAAGTAVITVSSQGITATRTVTVTTAALSHLEVSPPNVALPAGSAKSFQAVATYADGTVEDVTRGAQWSSSNEGMLTVENAPLEAGRAAFLAPGTVSLQASWAGTTASQTVRVTNATVTGVVIRPDEITLSVPDFQQLRPIVTYSDGSVVDGQELAVWTTDDPTVADVSNAQGSRGVVTAIGTGETDIIATVGGKSAKVEVEVNDRNYTGLTIRRDWTGNVTCFRGATVSLKADASYSFLERVDVTERAHWSSSLPTVAVVESGVERGGTVHCLEAGEVSITAAWRGSSDSVKVTVSNDAPSQITVSPANANVAIGETRRLTATAAYGRNRVDVTELATWTSTVPATATVSNAQGNQGVLLGVSAGTTSVTATFNGVVGQGAATVSSATLTKIVVTPTTPSISLWDGLQFKATAHYDNNTTADVTSQTQWVVSDPKVATIANDGRVSLINRSRGTTQVFATYGGQADHATLTVR